MIGAIFVVSGVTGCFLMGLFIDKTGKHLLGIRVITLTFAGLAVLSLILIPIGNLGVTGGIAFFLGLFIVPVLPSSYAFAAKQTVGMPPAVVNGLMMSGAQAYSFFVSLLITYILQFGQRYGLGLIVATQLVVVVLSLCTKDKPAPKKRIINLSGD